MSLDVLRNVWFVREAEMLEDEFSHRCVSPGAIFFIGGSQIKLHADIKTDKTARVSSRT